MGAFAGLGTGKFAASFSNSGGLGIVTALNYDLDSFKAVLKEIKTLTNKPVGINLSIAPPGIKTARGNLNEEDYLQYVEIGLNEGIKIFTTSAYRAAFIGKRVHEADCYWFHKCALPRHALSAEKAGADAVTIVGIEGAGAKHPLQQSTFVNIPLTKGLLKIPIIAAGGIGSAHSFLGALGLGAEGVCLGTVLMVTEECPTTKEIKKKWINTNIFEENYHKKIYDFNSKDIKTPSTAINYAKKIIPIKQLIKRIIKNAEFILKSWGFDSEEFSTFPKN